MDTLNTRIRSASDPAAIAEAAELLRRGGLVAFPTETVYGLGAHALDAEAVGRIFAAKGRPASNPLIVHVADTEAARRLASEWPARAERLAARFWPGPLTLVVPKAASVPPVVTADGDTVGVRVPAHPAALDLLRAAGVPVAAPSANRSEEVSPTTAQHVADSLGDRVDLILDGGPTEVGLESTVVDVTVSPPRLLRPGMITAAMLRGVVGKVILRTATPHEAGVARSPGQRARHYAPRTPLVLMSTGRMLERLRKDDGLLCRTIEPPDSRVDWRVAGIIALPNDPAGYAARLYAALREMDVTPGVNRIVVETPPAEPEWAAIRDRLLRAAAPSAGEDQ